MKLVSPSIIVYIILFHSTIQYLGFGLSGSTAVTSMFQADATIAWIDNDGVAQAKDYYLSGYVQVSPPPLSVYK